MSSYFPAPDLDLVKNRRTFRSSELQTDFRDDGFVSVPVLSEEEVTWLRDRYRELCPNSDSGLMVDYTRDDRTVMRALRDLAEPLVAQQVDEVFIDHEVCFMSMVTKHPGLNSSMFLHDDRSVVDERYHRSFTMWVPLVNVGPDSANGGLQMIAGSEHLGRTFSGSLTPQLFRPYEDVLAKLLETPSVAAGSGLIYDTRMLHSSLPNLTDSPREALVCAVVPRGVDLVHVVGLGRRRRRMFRVDQSFYLDNHPRDLEMEIPDNYIMIEEWDEDPGSVAAHVADMAGLATEPDPLVVMGSEAIGPATLSDEFIGLRAGAEASVLAAGLSDGTAVVSRHGYGLDDPPVAVRPVVDPDRWVPSLCSDEVDLVVVDPGGSTSIDVQTSRLSEALVVFIEAPPLGAVVRVGDDLLQPEPGRAVRFRDPGRIVISVVGPGPLVAVVAMVPRNRMIARVARWVLSLVPGRRAYLNERSATGLRLSEVLPVVVDA